MKLTNISHIPQRITMLYPHKFIAILFYYILKPLKQKTFRSLK